MSTGLIIFGTSGATIVIVYAVALIFAIVTVRRDNARRDAERKPRARPAPLQVVIGGKR